MQYFTVSCCKVDCTELKILMTGLFLRHEIKIKVARLPQTQMSPPFKCLCLCFYWNGTVNLT